jgi:acyl-CoA dehydrogenase
LCQEVSEIESKLREAARAGRVPPMPQSLAELPRWAHTAHALGCIDARERDTLVRYAHDGAAFVKVDDFPADFDRAEGRTAGAGEAAQAPTMKRDDQPSTNDASRTDLPVDVDRH